MPWGCSSVPRALQPPGRQRRPGCLRPGVRVQRRVPASGRWQPGGTVETPKCSAPTAPRPELAQKLLALGMGSTQGPTGQGGSTPLSPSQGPKGSRQLARTPGSQQPFVVLPTSQAHKNPLHLLQQATLDRTGAAGSTGSSGNLPGRWQQCCVGFPKGFLCSEQGGEGVHGLRGQPTAGRGQRGRLMVVLSTPKRVTLVQDPRFLLCFLCDAFSFLLFFSCFLGVPRTNLGHLQQQLEIGKEQKKPSEIQEFWIRDPKANHSWALLARPAPRQQRGARGRSSSRAEAPTEQSPGGAAAPKPHQCISSPLTHEKTQNISAVLCTAAPLRSQHRSGWEQTLLRAGSARLHVSPRHGQLLPEGSQTHGITPSAQPSLERAANTGAPGRQPGETRCWPLRAGRVLAASSGRAHPRRQAQAGPRRARGSLHPALGAGALGEGSQNKDDVSSDLGCEKQGGTGRWRLPALPSAASRDRLLPGAASALNAAPAAGESPAPACAGKASGSPNVPGGSGSVPRAKRFLRAFITREPSRGTRLSREGRG